MSGKNQLPALPTGADGKVPHCGSKYRSTTQGYCLGRRFGSRPRLRWQLTAEGGMVWPATDEGIEVVRACPGAQRADAGGEMRGPTTWPCQIGKHGDCPRESATNRGSRPCPCNCHKVGVAPLPLDHNDGGRP